MINMLYEDLANDSTLQNTYDNFISNFTNQLSTYLSSLVSNGQTLISFFQTFITNTLISNALSIKVYAYETPTLLSMWSMNYQNLSLDFFLKIFSPLFTLASEMNIIGSGTTIAAIEAYGALNANQTNTNNTNTSSTNDTTGTTTLGSLAQSQPGIFSTPQFTLSPLSNSTLPVNDIDNTQNNNFSFNYQGLETLTKIREMTDKVSGIVNKALNEVFSGYFAPFYSPLEAKKGVGW